jgi:hypothetical protein
VQKCGIPVCEALFLAKKHCALHLTPIYINVKILTVELLEAIFSTQQPQIDLLLPGQHSAADGIMTTFFTYLKLERIRCY